MSIGRRKRMAATVAAYLMVMGCVWATTPGQIIVPLGTTTPIGQSTQDEAAAALASNGVPLDQAMTVMTRSSNYTYLPAVSKAMDFNTVPKIDPITGLQVVDPATGNPVFIFGTTTGENLYTVMTSTNPLAVQSHRIANGTAALGSTNAARATALNLAGPNGVVVTHIRDEYAQRRSLMEEAGSDSALAVYRLNSYHANRFWAAGDYSYQGMDMKEGYSAYNYRSWGGTVGYDRAIGPLTLGAAFHYSRGDYDDEGLQDDNTIDNYAGSLYGSYYHCESGFFANAYGGYNYGDNDMKQFDPVIGEWQSGKNHTDTYWVGGEIGMEFRLGQSFSLAPSVGLLWLHAEGSAYRSTGVYDMNIDKIKNRGFFLPVQLEAKYQVDFSECSSLTFRGIGGYSYDFKNEGGRGSMNYNHAGSTPVLIQGVKPGKHNYNIGGGARYANDRFDIGVDYRYDWKDKYDSHWVSASVGVRF